MLRRTASDHASSLLLYPSPPPFINRLTTYLYPLIRSVPFLRVRRSEGRGFTSLSRRLYTVATAAFLVSVVSFLPSSITTHHLLDSRA